MLPSLFRSGSFLFFGIMLGRVFGFIREIVIGYNYGGSSVADAVVLMLTIPDLLINVLLVGGFSAALIPEFKRASPEESWCLFVRSSFFVGAVFLLLALLLMMFADKLLFFFSPGFAPHKLQYISSLLRITLLTLPFTALAGVATAFLQSNNRFGVAALGTSIFNLSIIVGLYLMPEKNDIHRITYFVVMGAVIRLLVQYAVVLKFMVPKVKNISFHGQFKVFRRYLEASFSAGCMLLLPIIIRSELSYEGDGVVSIFNYAIKISDSIYGAGISLIAVVILPKVSELVARGKEHFQLYSGFLKECMYLVIVFSTAITLAFVFYRSDIVSLIYYRGSMQLDAVKMIAFIVQFTLCALPLQGISSIFMVMYNAERDTFTPFLIYFTSVLGGVLFSILARKYFGIAGVMSLLVFVHLIVVIVQGYILSKKHDILVVSYIFNMDVFRCVFILFFVTVVSYLVISAFQPQPLTKVMLGMVFMFVGILLVIVTTKRYRVYMSDKLSAYSGSISNR
jgi:putative peptidoglycan lipid II flippase